VAVTYRVLRFSRQAFYAWDADPVGNRDFDDAHLVNAILDVHSDDPEFGYRFIADVLTADPSLAGASENRIWRLCLENGLRSSQAEHRTAEGKLNLCAVKLVAASCALRGEHRSRGSGWFLGGCCVAGWLPEQAHADG